MTEVEARRAEAASLVVGVSLAVALALVVADPGWPSTGHAHAAPPAAPHPHAARRVAARPHRPRARHRPAAHRPVVVAHRHRAAPRPAVPRRHSGATAVERLARTGLPLVCGGGRRRVVALTFDDGPGPYTGRLLGVLRRHHARATFFLVGNRIAHWPRVPAAEAKLGAVGDHTWSHAFLPLLSDTAAAAEVVRGREAAERAVHADVRLFRPPYDGRPVSVRRRLRARGMLEVLWSIDPSDYVRGRSVAAMVDYIAAGLRPGSIVLLHDIQPRTADVADRVLQIMHRRHLRAVAIPELLRVDPPSARLLAEGGPGCWR